MTIKIFRYNNLQINFWINHGIKITILDDKLMYPFANISHKNALINIRDMLNEVIESME
jgi:hypothetical protein